MDKASVHIFNFGSLFSIFHRGEISQRFMWSFVIVIISPLFSHYSYFCQAFKQIRVEQFLSYASIFSFNKSVLHRLAWLYVLQCNLVFSTPLLQGMADKFRTIIYPDGDWFVSFIN